MSSTLFWIFWLVLGWTGGVTFWYISESMRKRSDELWGHLSPRQYYCPTVGHVLLIFLFSSILGPLSWVPAGVEFVEAFCTRGGFNWLIRLLNYNLCDLFRNKDGSGNVSQ